MDQSPLDGLKQAEEHLRAGRRREAMAVLRDCLRSDPASAQAWWLMSFAVDDPHRQSECLERLLQLRPDIANARERMSKLQADLGRGQSAPAVSQPARPAIPSAQKPRQAARTPWMGILIALLVVVSLGFAYVLGDWYLRGAAQARARHLQETMDVARVLTSLPPRSLPATWTPSPSWTPRPSFTSLETQTPEAEASALPSATILLVLPGYPAPDFTLSDSQSGEKVSLSRFAGRPLLMVFMVSWCHSCEQQAPFLEGLYAKYQDAGLVVLGVDVGEDSATVDDFRTKNGLTFPILLDSTGKVFRLYKVRYYPSQFYIRPDGVIATMDDQVEWTGALEVRVKMLLEGSLTPTPSATLPPASTP